MAIERCYDFPEFRGDLVNFDAVPLAAESKHDIRELGGYLRKFVWDPAPMTDDMDNYQDLLESLVNVMEFIFSWVILLPIGVIISGKYLSQHIKLSEPGEALFSVGIPGVLKIKALNNEVIFGFTGYIISLSFIGLIFGDDAYQLFVKKFGVDPGQWNSLGTLSSMAVVAWSFLTHLFLGFLETRRDRRYEEHDRVIERLAMAKMTRHGDG